MRRWGIHNHSQVVVYDSAGGAFAARFWWCLRWLGHANVALLDGGLAAFSEPMATGADPSRQAEAPVHGTCQQRPSLTRTINPDDLLERISAAGDAFANLLDARTQERFDGVQEPIDAVAGHIPGAICLPFQQNLASDGRFLPAAQLATRFADSQAHPAGDPVCYCGSGVTAAHNLLAMVHAGLPEPLLYPGSWSEWIADPSRPRQPS